MEPNSKTAAPAGALGALPTGSPVNIQQDILRVLIYYDIWRHPLTARELYEFLPSSHRSFCKFRSTLDDIVARGVIHEYAGYYYLPARSRSICRERMQKQSYAQRLWKRARLSMHVIKRFPFVRAVFVSGDLSKNVATPSSDVDFFILTAPDRLWIARTLLILFKKLFLLNSRKYFCLNYFSTTDHLAEEQHDIYTATEVATLKPFFNSNLFHAYMEANGWIHDVFPNHTATEPPPVGVSEQTSRLQHLLEALFELLPADLIDRRLQNRWQRLWAHRYPDIEPETRERIFRCSRYTSRAYIGDFQVKILNLYRQALTAHGLCPPYEETAFPPAPVSPAAEVVTRAVA